MGTLKNRRILFVADSPTGGAGVAAQRLLESLESSGFELRYLVFQGASGRAEAWSKPASLGTTTGLRRKFLKAWAAAREACGSLSRWLRAAKRDRFFKGSPDQFEITTIYLGRARLEDHPWYHWADIIHLHWTAGFLAPKQSWAEKIWVISLHDANPFTAVCHFPAGCTNFQTGCQTCPQLAATRNPEWSRPVFERKRKGYGAGGRITLHAPSRWIAQLAATSPLTRGFPSRILSNVFPSDVFRPLDQRACRELLGLPMNGRIALFVAGHVANVRKGFSWFVQLAESLVGTPWTFVLVGAGEILQLPSNCVGLGRLGDLRLMAAAYSAADVFISTALEDNYPSTIAESQLCGTPVVGFAVGGQPEMVHQGETGYLAAEVGLDGLRQGIDWFETAKPRRDRVAALAFERWNLKTVTDQWVRFYQELT